MKLWNISSAGSKSKMNKILILLAAGSFLLLTGCDNSGSNIPVNKEVKAKENAKIFRCRNCRHTAENLHIKRVNQTRGICPKCRKVALFIPVR